ncbi:MAG: adenylate/guanylate cyclase domain-containing protein [Caulobacteraceae bacterium]
MAQPDMDHRLAAIVAVDIAGYSSRAEADEGAAVRAVAALSGLIDQIAQDHAGRVFNTAGDGFMLEFPTASGALAAAKDLAAEADIPIRVGVHLGEVYATTSGDLLGHGVNVAARLQALAKPGSIMVSDDVRRAVRGALVQGLVSQGRHRLDKMKETAEVFSLSAAPPARKTIWPAWAAGKAGLKVGGAAALALLLLAAAAFGVSAFRPGSRMPPNLTTAVRDFTVRGAGLDPQFGRSLADGVAAALGERQAPTVSRDLARRGDFGGARLLVGGEVEQVGQNLREHIHIDDGQAGLILWAGDLQRPVDQADGLRDETAAKVTDIIDRLRTQIGPEAAALKPEAMAAVMKALEIERLGVNRVNRAREAWTRVVELAPNFSRGHSSLAFADLYSNDAMTPQQVQMRREGRAQADQDRPGAGPPQRRALPAVGLTGEGRRPGRPGLLDRPRPGGRSGPRRPQRHGGQPARRRRPAHAIPGIPPARPGGRSPVAIQDAGGDIQPDPDQSLARGARPGRSRGQCVARLSHPAGGAAHHELDLRRPGQGARGAGRGGGARRPHERSGRRGLAPGAGRPGRQAGARDRRPRPGASRARGPADRPGPGRKRPGPVGPEGPGVPGAGSPAVHGARALLHLDPVFGRQRQPLERSPVSRADGAPGHRALLAGDRALAGPVQAARPARLLPGRGPRVTQDGPEPGSGPSAGAGSVRGAESLADPDQARSARGDAGHDAIAGGGDQGGRGRGRPPRPGSDGSSARTGPFR